MLMLRARATRGDLGILFSGNPRMQDGFTIRVMARVRGRVRAMVKVNPNTNTNPNTFSQP